MVVFTLIYLTSGKCGMSNHLRVLAFVGIVSLFLSQGEAHANSVTPLSASCTVSTGIDDPVIGGCSAAPIGLSGEVTYPFLSGDAFVSIGLNQSVSAVAALSQANNPYSQGLGFAHATGTLSYSLVVAPINPNNPGSQYVPITMQGESTLTDLDFSAHNTASTSVTVQTADQTQTVFQTGDSQTVPQLGQQHGYIDTGFNLLEGATYLVTLTADAAVYQDTDTETALIDPVFSFTDPADASLYQLDFSPGITNGVSATPLPAALPLFAGGLGVFGFLARRRKAVGSTAV
jgi:hypothetical protein